MLYASISSAFAVFCLKDGCGVFFVAAGCFAALLWVFLCLALLSALT